MLSELDSAAANLSQEEPPIEFRIDFRSSPSAMPFGRFDFLNTVILAMSTMALKAWNEQVANCKFPAAFHIAIGFVSSRSGPGLRAKHIMWSLERIFDFVVDDDSYLPGNVVVDVGSTTLGVGNVYNAPADTAPVKFSETPTGDTGDGTPGGLTLESKWALSNHTVSGSDFALPVYWQGNVSPVQSFPLSQSSGTSSHLNPAGDVRLQFWYRSNGAHVDDAQVYNASLKLLVKAAEPADLKGSVWPGLFTYSDMDDFTFTIRPASFATRNDLSWFDTIFSLASIAGMMSKNGGPPGRFMELYGRISVGTTPVGNFCIDKGDKTGLDLEDLCNAEDQGIGDEEERLAAA